MKEKSKIIIDFDKYWPFQLNNGKNNVIAIEKAKLSSIFEERKKYNGFENIPSTILIEGIILNFDSVNDSYNMDEIKHLNNVSMSDLIVIDTYAKSLGSIEDYLKKEAS
ncbi:MAG TPA: hypothetical protein VJI69_08950 [Bacteroidia bacterium]|nr:hypothetical protein [Bacteroidia bacterium]